MKPIKIKICGHTPDAEGTFGSFFVAHLKKFYTVELSEEPDYVFFYERDDEHLNYPNAVRIFYTGENVHPDFNMCDYAISFDLLEFGDRHFRLPLYMVATLYDEIDIKEAGDLTFEHVPPFPLEELKKKTGFCSFVYSNPLADPKRKELFDALSAYKKVDSGGRYLNNTDGPVAHKLLFEREHKFSIAFENSSREGYVTEKLPAALAARTIPIYFGDPTVGREFNTCRFINAHDFADFNAVVARVKAIDENDEEYLRIINEPVLAEGFHYRETLDAFDAFLRNVFDQPLEKAKRRTINAHHAHLLEKRDRAFFNGQKKSRRLRALLSPLKKISVLNKMKEYFQGRTIHHQKHD